MPTRHCLPLQHGARRLRELVIVALVLAIAQHEAGAQVTYTSAFREAYDANGGGAHTVCGRDSQGDLSATAVSFDCTLDGIRGIGSGSVDNGILRALTSVSGSGLLSPDVYTRAGVYVQEAWNDRLLLSPLGSSVQPAFVDLFARFTGAADHLAIPGNGQSIVAMQGSGALGAYGGYAVGSGSSVVNYQMQAGVSDSPISGPDHVVNAYDDVLTVRVPYAEAIDFSLSLNLWDYMAVYTPDGEPFTGYGTTDFSHTAGITGMIVRDADGNDITSDVRYSFDNGTQLLGVTTAPEPGSLVLLGTGLGGLFGIAARRRGIR